MIKITREDIVDNLKELKNSMCCDKWNFQCALTLSIELIEHLTDDEFNNIVCKMRDEVPEEIDNYMFKIMREATAEEQRSVDKYIENILKDTGIDFWEERDQDDN